MSEDRELLQPALYDVLNAIASAGGRLTSNELAERTDRMPTHTRTALRRLYDRGLVERYGEGGPRDPYRYAIPTDVDVEEFLRAPAPGVGGRIGGDLAATLARLREQEQKR